MKHIRLLLLVFALLGSATAQTGKPVRLEFPAERYSTELQRVLCDTLGVCVLYPSVVNDSSYCHILQYDANMVKTNESRFPLANRLWVTASDFSRDRLFILCQKTNKKKKESEGLLVTYDLASHALEQHPVRNLPSSDISHFTVRGGNILFTAPVNSNQTNIFFLPKGETSVQALRLPNAPDYTIDDFVAEDDGSGATVCVNTSSNSKNNVLWLCETDMAGLPLRVVDFPDTGETRYQNARIVRMGDGSLLIAGTYQLRKTSGNTATGIYSIRYDAHQFGTPQEYPFKQSLTAGRNNSDILFLAGHIYPNDSICAFVTESFYPEYRYTTTYSYGVPTTEPVFMGYRFIDAEVHVFDTSGSRIWNYSMPFDNLMVTNLTTHLRVSFLPSYIIYYYTLNQTLTTMLTDFQFNLLDPIRTSELFPSTTSKGPISYNIALNPWYGNNFILSGYRFRQGNAKSKMPVYFLNKLRYE